MKKQANREAILISAVLTVMLLTFVGGTAFAAKRIFALKSGILAASFGTVLLGWTMLTQGEVHPYNHHDLTESAAHVTIISAR
jgi:hypothetical protein